MISGFFGLMTFPISYDWAALLVRLGVGLALLPYGLKKFSDRSGAAHFPKIRFFSQKSGFYAVMIIELVVPVCLILGLFTRMIVVPAICSMAVATAVTKGPYLTSPASIYFLMLIVIMCMGAGGFSLDYLLLNSI